MRRITSILVFLVFVGYSVFAQDIQITGKVTSSEDGSPLPGVSVVVKGTTTGTTTNVDGNFSISAPADATLVFSFVGMETQEIPVAKQTVINVVMKPAMTQVSEVVVTAFGISKSRKSLGYSSVEMSGDQTMQKSEPDLLRSLTGRVPGVEIRSTGGQPGSATRITIRGNSSFAGNNQPLFVVDGVPYSNDEYNTTDLSTGGGAYSSGISTLDPNDIESTTVLKGAAAAALYGSRAKNGVIIIKTKSGSANARGLNVTVNSSVNWETIAKLPVYQNTYGNGANFIYQNANGSWGPRFDALDSIPTWPGYSSVFGWGDSIPYVAQPNNVKDLFKTGMVYENSLNVQSGNDKSTFSLTISDLRNSGYIPFSKFNRTNIGVGGSTKFLKRFTAKANATYATSDQVGGIFGNNQASDGYGASSFARALWLGRTWIMNPYEDPVTGYPMQPNGAQFDNPLWSWKHNQIITNVDRITASGQLSLKAADWLTLSYKLAEDSYIQRRKEIVDIGSRANVFGGKGGVTTDNVVNNELYSIFLANFNKTFGKLDISGSVGTDATQNKTDRQAFRGFEFINSGIYTIDNTKNIVSYTNTASAYGGEYEEKRLVGAFGDVTFGYNNNLFLDLTGRNDWSSTLPPEHKSYFYPAAALSYIFSDALHLQSNLFNYGQLRLSWGRVGLDATPYNVYQRYFVRTGSFPFLGQPAMYTPNTAYDPKLSPEFKEDIEAGTQLVFLNNRVNLDFTYYHNKSTKLLYSVFVAPSSGYSNYYTNVGRMDNNGVEVALKLGLVKSTVSNGFNWNMNFTFTKNKNEVKSINGVDTITYINQLFGDPNSAIIVGKPYGVLYGTVSLRDSKGNLMIDPASGLMIVDPVNRVYGDPNPDYQLGINNIFSFKGFTFTFFFDFKKGGDLFSNSITSLLGRGVTKDTQDREKTVILPGYYGNTDTYVPLTDANGNEIPNTTQVTVNDLYFTGGNVSSFAINAAGEWQTYDATILRLREVTFGYDLPASLLQKTPIKGINLSVSARNFWYWAPNIPKYTNFDPAVSTYGATNVQGVEYSGAPSTKRIGINLRLTF